MTKRAQTPLADVQDLDQHIRALAYRLWEKKGRPDGTAVDFWLQAEREILASRAAEVRTAGRKEMQNPPSDWDMVDEQSDESFPASDPPGNY